VEQEFREGSGALGFCGTATLGCVGFAIVIAVSGECKVHKTTQRRVAVPLDRKEKRMPATFDWDDAEEIGIQLAEKYPDADPLSVRYTDLHKYITGLEGFTGDPKQSNEGKLEAIQMAWLEEHNERKS
jgi:FeS assembly protein IscX